MNQEEKLELTNGLQEYKFKLIENLFLLILVQKNLS